VEEGRRRKWQAARAGDGRLVGVVFISLAASTVKNFNCGNVRREGDRGDDGRPRFAVPNFLAVWVK
jgi:hypothetical protein